jgi:ribosomal protein S18 acetylase RimI-like enzyme
VRELSVKSSLAEKLRCAKAILADKGLINFCQAIYGYIVYHLSTKWHFVYYELPLEQKIFSLKTKEPITVKIATFEDLERIKADIFPDLVGGMESDKRYFKFIGHPGIQCFLAEREGKLIYYAWVFMDAFDSLIMEVPFDKTKLRAGDAFIGSVFTAPAVRGMSVHPCVLSTILDYLRANGCARRVLFFVDGKNTSAQAFYERLGFKEIDVQPGSSCGYVVTALMNFGKNCWVRKGRLFGLRKEKTR